MSKYTSQSEATQTLAAQQTHNDMHGGRGVVTAPTHGDIANRAYDLYVQSGSKKGHCTQNWLKAEHDLRASGR